MPEEATFLNDFGYLARHMVHPVGIASVDHLEDFSRKGSQAVWVVCIKLFDTAAVDEIVVEKAYFRWDLQVLDRGQFACFTI